MKDRKTEGRSIAARICKGISGLHFVAGMFWVMCIDSPEHFAVILASMIYSFAAAAAFAFLVLIIEDRAAEDPGEEWPAEYAEPRKAA